MSEAQTLSMEYTVAAAAAKVLANAGITVYTTATASPERVYPSVLVEPDDLTVAITQSDGCSGFWRVMLYIHCDTYLPDDANGAGNASLVSLVRGQVFTGLRAKVAEQCAEYTFFAAIPGKAYAADETNLRRVTQEVEIIFTPTATTTEE